MKAALLAIAALAVTAAQAVRIKNPDTSLEPATTTSMRPAFGWYMSQDDERLDDEPLGEEALDEEALDGQELDDESLNYLQPDVLQQYAEWLSNIHSGDEDVNEDIFPDSNERTFEQIRDEMQRAIRAIKLRTLSLQLQACVFGRLLMQAWRFGGL